MSKDIYDDYAPRHGYDSQENFHEVKQPYRPFFQGSRSVKVNLITITPTNIWIFDSRNKTDPYCVEDIRYDLWWLQNNDVGAHCTQLMSKRDCFLVYHEEKDKTIEFLQVETHAVCYGLSSGPTKITKGRALGWRRIYRGNNITPMII